jgi:hypothetical protein
MFSDSLPNANATIVIETLESRTLMSVVSVSPVGGDATNDIKAAIAASHPGDTISFNAGTYSLSNPLVLPGNRIYQGNGVAVINGTTAGKSTFMFSGVTGATVTGFTFTGSALQLSNCSVNVENNKFNNINGNGIFATGIYSTHINNNNFSNISNTGMMLYPGNNNTFDGNIFTNVYEPIHALGGSASTPINNVDFSQNTITQASRIGIELQMNVNNLTCNDNYMSNWLNPPSQVWAVNGLAAHMGISAACGQSSRAPYVGGGNGMTFEGNTILMNGLSGQNTAMDPVQLSCFELMGKNITLKNNYLFGGVGYLNGAIGSASSSGNTIVAYEAVANGDSTPWPVVPISVAADHVYRPGAANVPPAPSVAATVG